MTRYNKIWTQAVIIIPCQRWSINFMEFSIDKKITMETKCSANERFQAKIAWINIKMVCKVGLIGRSQWKNSFPGIQIESSQSNRTELSWTKPIARNENSTICTECVNSINIDTSKGHNVCSLFTVHCPCMCVCARATITFYGIV